MTLQRTKKDDSKNDDDDDDDVNEDEGITEIISESKRTPRGSSTNRVTSSAGVAVVSNPLYSGQSISTSKKTAQALRFLQKAKQISSETKNLLLLNIIDSAARDRVSLVETSFELLVLDHFIGSPEELYMWRPTTFDKGMDEFLDQCEEVAETIRKEQSLLKSSVSTVKSAVTKAGGKSEKKKSKDKNVDE